MSTNELANRPKLSPRNNLIKYKKSHKSDIKSSATVGLGATESKEQNSKQIIQHNTVFDTEDPAEIQRGTFKMKKRSLLRRPGSI